MTMVDIFKTRVNGKEVKSMETGRERERDGFSTGKRHERNEREFLIQI